MEVTETLLVLLDISNNGYEILHTPSRPAVRLC